VAVEQHLAANALGFWPLVPNAGNTATAMTASSNPVGVAMGFVLPVGKTLTEVSMWFTGFGGTLSAGDLQCDIVPDNGTGTPNIAGGALATATIASPPNVASWVRWAFNLALTAATPYWAVFRNNNASLSATIQSSGANTGPFTTGGNGLFGWSRRLNNSTNWASPNWGAVSACVAGMRLGFSDGTYNGLPHQGIVDAASAYQANEVGMKFTMPAGAIFNCAGLGFWMSGIGTALNIGGAKFRLYAGNDTVPLAETAVAGATSIVNNASWYALYFPASVPLQPGAVYRATMKATGAGSTNANFINPRFAQYNWDPDPGSAGLKPIGGSAIGATFNGTVWAADPSPPWIIPFVLLPDTSGDYTAVPSGGGGGGGGSNAINFGGLMGAA
jgi:hypothetical protein